MVGKTGKLLALGVTALAMSTLAGLVSAQEVWPNRAIRIINPFPAGGGTDAFARPLAARLNTELGQQILIENIGGAGGTLGASVAAKAPGNGYNWFMGAVHHTIAETLYTKLQYSLERDFMPVTVAAYVPSAVVIHPSIPAKTVKELIALEKKNPGKINFGSAGYGTTHHMNGELFNLITGTKLIHVPFKGAGPLTPALMSGEVDMAFDGMGTAAPNIKAGRLRALAVSTAKRSTAFPELPTVAEGGAPGYEYTSWYGLLAPRNTPAAIVGSLSTAVAQALKTKEVSSFLSGEGFELDGNGPAAFRNFLAAEVAKYIELTPTIAGLRID